MRMEREARGMVFLVGAGCGPADLITVRGLRLLEQCDAVVYDDLIDRELLLAAPEHARRIYMGKRQGKHGASQEEICETLIRLAREGLRVVRLKGGDPYVFGRGGEEMLALKAAGIFCEQVPGITSAAAIPAEAGIPVTHRGMSRSFHVITGHTAQGKEGLPEDLEKLAGLNGTLVFLMGLSHLDAIAGGLMKAGKSPDTPAAVLRGGCAPDRQAVRGTLGMIGEMVRQAGIKPPAVIVVGETAGLNLSAESALPLLGVQAGLVGTPAVTEKLKSLLEHAGARVQTVLRAQVEALPLSIDLEALCDGSPRWLVFTSANGVRVFFDALHGQKIDLRRLAACRFAVIGPATGDALSDRGILPDLCPETYTSAALADALAERMKAEGETGEAVLLRSRKGAKILPETLRAAGFAVRDVPLYDVRAILPAEGGPALEEGALPWKLDYLLFSSAGGVEQFFAQYGAVPEGTVCACIGEVTAGQLKKHAAKDSGRPAPYTGNILTAREATAQALAEAVIRDAQEQACQKRANMF